MTQRVPFDKQATSVESAALQLQRRRARRTALWLGLLALGMYLGFILSTGLRN